MSRVPMEIQSGSRIDFKDTRTRGILNIPHKYIYAPNLEARDGIHALYRKIINAWIDNISNVYNSRTRIRQTESV